MKKVGIIGGTGPESTVDYYQSIVTKYQEKIGTKEDLPELFINCINMYKMFDLLMNNQTQKLIQYLTDAVKKLERIGSDFVVFSGNTPHIVFKEVQQQVQVPLISIIEETCLKAQEFDIKRVGLLGTIFTMENDFFKNPFISVKKEIFVPNQSEQEYIHRKIVEELQNGIVNTETKNQFLNIINEMVRREDIQGIILGCTELPLLIKNKDLNIFSLNTTDIHVNKIVNCIFGD
ncbi:amino acid racemase [Oceanobacillus sp. FSL K6-2867]|uniref:aspartate/glutamate racemase family protein n=1 Tax=Oceanobacillus sp. FSL K6-2867 TaxID=2954748 RepID=UPI0030D9F14C